MSIQLVATMPNILTSVAKECQFPNMGNVESELRLLCKPLLSNTFKYCTLNLFSLNSKSLLPNFTIC